jgi:hypothetical protein
VRRDDVFFAVDHRVGDTAERLERAAVADSAIRKSPRGSAS